MSGDDRARPATLLEPIPAAGRTSSLLREIRTLSRDPAARRRECLAIAEGIHLALEALRDPSRIRSALVSPRILRTDEGRSIVADLIRGPFPARRVEDRLLADLGDTESHQGILLVVRRPLWSLKDLLPDPGPPLVLVACGVQDPGNLGALARVAEASWASGLVCAGGGADPFSPRSLRASAGSLLRLPAIESTNSLAAAADLRSAGLRLVGASLRASAGYREEAMMGPLAIFIGSEAAGLPSSLEPALDALVRIPMRDGVDSLNVAAAAAVLLFEAAARRGAR